MKRQLQHKLLRPRHDRARITGGVGDGRNDRRFMTGRKGGLPNLEKPSNGFRLLS
jgi:hypothetical protein